MKCVVNELHGKFLKRNISESFYSDSKNLMSSDSHNSARKFVRSPCLKKYLYFNDMDHTQLEKLCLSLKGTTTDIKWGNDLCYLIGEKMYCVTSLDKPMRVSMKVQPEEFGELTEREGIIPAPYMARNHWIFVEKSNAFTAKEWKQY